MSETLARRQLAFDALLVAVAVGAVVSGVGYGLTDEEGRIGAGFLPAICGAVLLACAVVDGVAQARRLRHQTRDDVSIPDPAGVGNAAVAADLGPEPGGPMPEQPDVDVLGRTNDERKRMLAAVLGLVLVTVLIVPVVGFITAFALMLVAIAVLVEKRRLLPAVLVSASVLGAIYAVFALFLSVPFPTGLLGLI